MKQTIKLSIKRQVTFYHFRPGVRLLFLLLCLTAAPPESFGQTAAVQRGAANKFDRRVKISINGLERISIKADDISPDALADRMSRRLGIPVVFSPLVRGKSLTLDFNNLPLEQAVRLLSPHARIDYVASQRENGRLRPLAIYLNGYNEPEPTTERSVESESLAVVIEGETDAAADIAFSERLKINFTEDRLSVSARRQNLGYVVSEIATAAGLEFDLRYDGEQLIDVEIRNEPLIEALVRLSPHVRVYLRKDLLTERTTAFRVSISKPEEPLATNTE